MTSDQEDTNVPITPRQGSGTLIPGMAQREAARNDGPVAPAVPAAPIPEPAAQWEADPEIAATSVPTQTEPTPSETQAGSFPAEEPGFLDQISDGSGWDDVSEPEPPVPVVTQQPAQAPATAPTPLPGRPIEAVPSTVFMPQGTSLKDLAAASIDTTPPPLSPTQPPPMQAAPIQRETTQMTDGSQGRIAIGSVLNNIYQVKRFIARGGMGEVYEGVNITSDERVAIKVVLSHLAEDPTVVDMFLKEAKTLTRFAHPALVQYRVLAKEPALDILYIVTEFIEGSDLGEMIGTIKPSYGLILTLMRRLCSGLQAAHQLGAVHRDMSPDNVLLPNGKLDQAKIIDFGIAKNLDASARTIIGDGFAGKMGFATPEQFGAYGRKIGPWTDIYSVALVCLAFANKRPVYMGADPFEALEIRKNGPDISCLPPTLQPVFARMLAPDPADRFQDMGAVLQALDEADKAASAPFPYEDEAAQSAPKGKSMMLAGIGGAVLIGAVALYLVFSKLSGGGGGDAPAGAASSGGGSGQIAMASILDRTSNAVSSQSCTVLNAELGQGRKINLSGAAADPAAVATNLSGIIGDPSVSFNSDGVAGVTPQVCAVLDVFRSLRTRPPSQPATVLVSKSKFSLKGSNQGVCPVNTAQVLTTLKPKQADFTIIGIVDGKSREASQFFKSRSDLEAAVRDAPEDFKRIGPNTYEILTCVDAVGTYGVVLIEGVGPFDVALPDLRDEGALNVRDAAWANTVVAQAKSRGWSADSVWYNVE
jgi:eukaryotic-like serine/threonine-protein kinase